MFLGDYGMAVISHLETDFLHARFEVALRKFMLVKWQVDGLSEAHNDLKKELGTFALGFLAHGAMITLSTERESMNVSPIEFRGDNVNIDGLYHRAANGMAATKLFKELFQESGNPCSDLIPALPASQSKTQPYSVGKSSRRDTSVLVDGPQIMAALEHIYTVVRPNDGSKAAMSAAIQTRLTESQMLDLSLCFLPPEGSVLSDQQLRNRVSDIRQAIYENIKKIKYMAVFATLTVQGVTIALAFDTKVRKDNDVQDHHKELTTIANYGSRIDIVRVREAIVNLANMDTLLDKLSLAGPRPMIQADKASESVHCSRETLYPALAALREALDANAVQSAPQSRERLYYGLVSQLLHFISDHLEEGINNPVINGYVTDTLVRMEEILLESLSHHHYAPFMNCIDLLVEDTIHITTLLRLPRTNIPEMLNQIPIDLPDGVQRNSYIFNSGMKCTQCILVAIKAMHDKPTVGRSSDIYFEERSLIDSHAPQTLGEISQINFSSAAPINKDVVFFDFLPNAAAVITDVSEHEGVSAVRKALLGRSLDCPTTVVIDATTDIFDGARTRLFLQTLVLQLHYLGEF